MIMEYYGSLWMFNVYGCWLMFMDAIACCLMPFLGHLPLQEASETPTLELEKPELVELMEDVVVNSRATDHSEPREPYRGVLLYEPLWSV